MPAVQDTIDRVRKIDVDQYKYGFETSIETDKAPKGPERRHHPVHLGQEERAGMDAGMAAGGLSPLADAGGADLGARVTIRRSISRTSTTTPRRRARRARRSLDDVDPELLKVYEKLGIPLKEQEILAGVRKRRRGDPERDEANDNVYKSGRVAVDAVFDSVSVVTTFKEELAQGRRHLLLDLGSDPRASGAGEEISRLGRADHATISTRR